MSFKQEYDRAKAEGWLDFFKAASIKYSTDTKPITVELLLGMASRETGILNIIGDHGYGHGVMQIDSRWHHHFLVNNKNGMDPFTNIDYGALLLAANLRAYNGDLFNAISAYNCGSGSVNKALRDGKSAEAFTTGGDYATDCTGRAAKFKAIMEADI
jgi:hypothetical protein